MTLRRLAALLALFVAVARPNTAVPDDAEPDDPWSGRVGVSQKYDSNVDLLAEEPRPDADPDDVVKDAHITEVFGAIGWMSPGYGPWRLSADLFALADLFPENMDDTWAIGRGHLDGAYRFGANALRLRSEAGGYTEPDDTEYDNWGAESSLAYACELGAVWTLSGGYQNELRRYPSATVFDFGGHGALLEVRQNWTARFSTSQRYDVWFLDGRGEEDDEGRLGAPSRVVRHAVEVAAESLIGRRHALGAAYAYQVDDAANDGAYQIGEIQGEDENLEIDGEFNVAKHRATLLYSVRIAERFSVAFYNEALHRVFLGADAKLYGGERIDASYLGSAWVSARLYAMLFARVRYLYRMNDSRVDYLDFQDHVVLGGLEYRF